MRWARWLTLLRLTGRDGLVLLAALRDAQTPKVVKWGTIAMLAYVISPIDLLPDLAMMLGWADDLAVLMVSIPWLAARLPGPVRERAGQRVSRWLRAVPGPRNP